MQRTSFTDLPPHLGQHILDTAARQTEGISGVHNLAIFSRQQYPGDDLASRIVGRPQYMPAARKKSGPDDTRPMSKRGKNSMRTDEFKRRLKQERAIEYKDGTKKIGGKPWNQAAIRRSNPSNREHLYRNIRTDAKLRGYAKADSRADRMMSAEGNPNRAKNKWDLTSPKYAESMLG